MSVHLIKMCVGVRDIAHLIELQRNRVEQAILRGETPVLRHITRHTPRRAAELLDGGSLYWVIKGFVRVRQRLAGIERTVNSEGRPSCALILDSKLVRTELRPCRPFQGWRYLAGEKAPPDAASLKAGSGEVPPELAAELHALGLL